MMELHDIYMAAQLAAQNSSGSLPTGALKLKGQVDSVEALPQTGNNDGDVYIVGTDADTDKAEYYRFGGQWNYLGETPVDLSEVVKKTDIASDDKTGIVKTAPNMGLAVNASGTIYVKDADDARVIAEGEANRRYALTLNKIPVMMNNYGIGSKTQIETMNSSIEENASNTAAISAALDYDARNILKNTKCGTSTQINNIVFDVDSDGVITITSADGQPASTAATFVFGSSTVFTDDARFRLGGRYILSGCTDGSSSTYDLRLYSVETIGSNKVNTSGDTPFLYNNSSGANVAVLVRAGFTPDGEKIYPMIRSADIAESGFEPYKPSIEQRLRALEAALADLSG